MDECCCESSGPPTFQIARAVSVLRVRTFHIHSFPGQQFFCSRSFFRQCNVIGTDNNRCGTPVGNLESVATVPIFAENPVGAFDPCITFERLTPSSPITFSDSLQTCRLSNNSGSDCWDATITLSVPTTIDDLIAGCLANLSLIDLDAVPLGTQRRVINDPFNGSPIFADFLISTGPPLPDACGSPFGGQLASSFAVRYAGIGEVAHCTDGHDRRVLMPTYSLTISASRSRFTTNTNWCKRTFEPALVDPNFIDTCNSQSGPCAQIACSHHLPATGIIDVPSVQQSIHIGLCPSPASPCNPTPIPF